MNKPAHRKRQAASPSRSAKRGKALSSKREAAAKLASMIEDHMTDLGLSEQEKNDRVARFSERVNTVIARHVRS